MATRLSRYRAAPPATIDQRCADRARVAFTRANVRHPDNDGAGAEPGDHAELHDLSIYGCRLSSGVELPAGERLWLCFAGGKPIAAEVIWSDAGRIGCRFDTPIERTLARSLTIAAA